MPSTLPLSPTPAMSAATHRTPSSTVKFACLAMLVSYLPFSAVNGALGTIGATTGADTADLQWLTDAFALALAATVLSAGVIGDLVGRRSVTLAGLGLTALGAAVAVTAGSFEGSTAVQTLWLAEGLAGLGGGAVMSSTLGLVAAASTDLAARRRAIAAWAAAITVGLGGGPFVAAAVTSWTNWRWLFLPILLLAVGVAAFGHRAALEFAAPQGRRLDVGGQTTSALGVTALVYAVIRGGTDGWADAITVGAFAVAVLAVACFLIIERHVAAPLLQLDLFASPGFTAAGIAATSMLFSIVGTVFTLSLLFAHQGASDLQIAVRLGCLFAANALASLIAVRLQTRFGAPLVLIAGLVIAAAGTALLTTTSPGAGLGGFAWRLAVAGVGSGLVMATASTVAVTSVPAELAGMAGAVNNALRQVGAALGAAILGSVLAGRLAGGAAFPTAVHFCAAALACLLALAALLCTALLNRPTSAHTA